MLFVEELSVAGSKLSIVLAGSTDTDCYSFKDILKSETVMHLLNNRYRNVYLGCFAESEEKKSLSSKLFPITVGSTSKQLKATKILAKLKAMKSEDLTPQYYTQLSSQLNKLFEKSNSEARISAKELASLKRGYDELIEYIKDAWTVVISMSADLYHTDNFARIGELIKLNNSKSQSSYLDSESNKTSTMETPTSRVFLRLPEYADIRNDVGNSIVRNYKKRDIYSDTLLNSKEFTMAGNTDNNDLPIQPNEQDFYNAICGLIKIGIKDAYPNQTLEECEKSHISNPIVNDFLLELCLEVARWHWGFTGKLSAGYDVDKEESDEDSDYEDDKKDNANDDGMGSKMFSNRLNIRPGRINVDGDSVLTSYISKACTQDIYAIAECLIKLLRVGSRKATKLKANCLDSYLDLVSFRMDSNSGSYADLEVKKVDGCEMEIVQDIIAMQRVRDTQYVKSLGLTNTTLGIPIGFNCVRSYVTGQSQFVAISFYELLQEMLSGKKIVPGISIVNSRVQVDESIIEALDESELNHPQLEQIQSRIKNDFNHKFVYYNSDEFKEEYMHKEVSMNKQSYIDILHTFLYSSSTTFYLSYSQYGDIEDFRSILESNQNIEPQMLIASRFASKILPITLQVAQEYNKLYDMGEDIGLEQTLNMYLKYILKQNGDTMLSNVAETHTKNMEVFGKAENVMDSSKVEPVLRQNSSVVELSPSNIESFNIKALVKEVPKTTPICVVYTPIADSPESKEIVFYFAKIDNNFVLIHRDRAGGYPLANNISNSSTMISVLLKDYLKIVTGKPETTKFKFADVEALDAILSGIKDILRPKNLADVGKYLYKK